MADYTVFYSWQSDLPNSVNRGFIQNALGKAVQTIHNDPTVPQGLIVDRDTLGVPGAPDIADTIYEKIERARVFVCDVSIINKNTQFIEGTQRPGQKLKFTPNPNVLLELGYALRALGATQIIGVVNLAFGEPEDLPFDLRPKRLLTYKLPDDQGETELIDKGQVRKKLEKDLEQAIRLILNIAAPAPPSPPTLGEQARAAIETGQANRTLLVTRYVAWVVSELDKLAPDYSAGGAPDDLLVQALDQTQSLVIDFARLAEIVAQVNEPELAHAVYKGFEGILNRYYVAYSFSGNFQGYDFDFHKFLGHELFVTFFTFLIQQKRWKLIADLLTEQLFVENSPGDGPTTVRYDYVSDGVRLLPERNRRLALARISVHADLLNERHTQADLGTLVPMQRFIEADYLLFLRSEEWRPWSTIYMTQQPRYIIEASSTRYAQRLLPPLGVADVTALRARLRERAKQLKQMNGPHWMFYVPQDSFDRIGSQ